MIDLRSCGNSPMPNRAEHVTLESHFAVNHTSRIKIFVQLRNELPLVILHLSNVEETETYSSAAIIALQVTLDVSVMH